MKNLFLFVSASLILTACDQAPVAPETSEPVIEKPAQTVIEMPTSISLPAFPDLPAPQTALEAGQSGEIYFKTKSPYDFAVLLTGYDTALPNTGQGHLILPKDASAENPVPAMVILHGSGGIQDGREMEYAQLFAENGIASFVVDYYQPRGATPDTPYMIKTLATSEVDVVTDAYSALIILGTHPGIDASRIGVTGYSYGGMTTRYANNQKIKDILAPDAPPFALHIDLYGPCHQKLGEGPTTGAPYLAIYGDNDNSVDPAACAVVQEDLRAGGSPVEAQLIPGAGHAWETKRTLQEYPSPYIRGCSFSYDQETGAFELNGQPGEPPADGLSRNDRALKRTNLGAEGMKCVGIGYVMGDDPETDAKSKAIQLEFMKRIFGL